MKITLDEMQAFITVVDSGSITAAAEQLGLTISATSRTLARLEAKLCTTLMRRSTRRLELTEEGATFLTRARQIVDSVQETEALMTLRRNQPEGRLRVDAASPFMRHVIVPLVSSYRARYPQVQLELTSNEGFIDLLGAQLAQAVLQAGNELAAREVVHPDLGGDEELLALDGGLAHGLADFGFIAVDLCGIDNPVAHFECIAHGIHNDLALQAKRAHAESWNMVHTKNSLRHAFVAARLR